MSQPNPTAERLDYLEELKKEVAQKVGMIYSGRNTENDLEFIGTQEQWYEYSTLLDEKLNEF